MIDNRTKQRLSAGQLVVGCFVRSPDPNIAEYIATGGWDFLVFDGEHGSVTPEHVASLSRACELRGVTPIVRVPGRDPGIVLRCLDAGAAGLHFPWVDSAEQARSAVTAAKYAPHGTRGLAGNRSTDWSVTREATRHVNDSTLVVAQIETREAVDNVEELCSVEGIDVLFVGPSDLSQSLGVPGELAHPSVVRSVERVAAAVVESGKVLGIFAGTPEAALRAIDLGAHYVATGLESLLGRAMSSFVQSVSRS